MIILCCLLASLLAPVKDSQLNYLIPAEIKDDSFYQAIQTLAEREDIQTILEIGSSNGEGSTEALVRGIQKNPRKPHLFCLEISKPRFLALQNRYANAPFVHCYRVSSVPIAAFPTEAALIAFHRQYGRQLSKSTPDLMWLIRWLYQDIDYVASENLPQNGIALIKSAHHIKHFDLVLIDGSEFTGEAELPLVYGAKYLLLDDVTSYKNFRNRQKLLSDPSYELIQEDLALRNGFSIFKKICK